VDAVTADDEEALSWAGDETIEPRTSAAAGIAARRVDGGPGRSGTAQAEPAPSESVPGQTGSVALVLLSLLGGFHLLYVVGWVLTIAPLQAAFRPLDALGAVMFSLGLLLAAASPVVWFAATFWFTRSRPSWQRIAGLLVGAVLLVPWPFVVGAG
jgi:hypothetical protein